MGHIMNGHGGYLGHVTWIVYVYHWYDMLHIKVGFDWPSGFGEDI